MGMVNILIAIGLLAVIIFIVIRLVPGRDDKDDVKDCPRCNGTGRIEELRGKVPCPQCKGTGKIKW